MNFSQLVRQQMKTKRMSIRRVSRLAELDPSFFAKVLRGERNPPEDERVLRKLAEALSVEPLELLLAVGRIPAEWRAKTGRPGVREALKRVFNGQSGASPWRRLGVDGAEGAPDRVFRPPRAAILRAGRLAGTHGDRNAASAKTLKRNDSAIGGSGRPADLSEDLL